MKFTNFYENLEEAQRRLSRTVVMYDGDPYYVLAILDSKGDGVFRAYLWPVGHDDSGRSWPSALDNMHPIHHAAQLAEYLDGLADKKAGVLRKKMDSPLFNRFRPFPLGMYNTGENTYFLERAPSRSREQGLTRNMISERRATLDDSGGGRSGAVTMTSKAFLDCIKGNHPSFDLAVEAVCSEVRNAMAFHRNFAVIRGPIETLFVAYKRYVVAFLPEPSSAVVQLGNEYKHLREAFEELSIFGKVL